MKQLHAAEAGWDNTTKTVGVEVKECKISEAAKLWRKITSNVGMIKVNAGNHSDFGVGRRGSTVDSHIRANIRAIPVGSEVKGVRKYGRLPSLQSNVGFTKPWVLKP